MLIHNNEDLDSINREQAVAELGDNYNEDLPRLVTNRSNTQREDMEAFEDRDIMP